MEKRGLLLDLVLVSDAHLLSRGAGGDRAAYGGVRVFRRRKCRSITRAVDEAVANVIRHAYGNRPNKSIEVCCKRVSGMLKGQRREGLEIQLLDKGVAL